MTISDRYRDLAEEVRCFAKVLRTAESEGKDTRMAEKASEGLSALQERVGEIPRIRLEAELTPVLLKAHTSLDRVRLLLEEKGEEDRAAQIWELEQKIYRLLNDL